jgi:adenosylcobinamide-phosphate synthase
MSFFSILIALLIEQIRPLGRKNPVRQWVPELIRSTCRHFDAGGRGHAVLIWCVLVLAPAFAVVFVQWALGMFLGWWAVLLWNVVILYFTLGFRQFSYHLTGIRKALDENKESEARRLLAQWRRLDTREFSRGHIYQRVMEASTVAAHRSVFGVFFWYAVFSAFGVGPAGAVMYRFSELCYRMLHRQESEALPQSPAVLAWFSQWWAWIDWVAVRLTAISFAMVGNFEEVIDRWRSLQIETPGLRVVDNERVLLSASFAAVNLVDPGPHGTPASVMEPKLAPEGGELAGERHHEPLLGMAELNLLIGLVWRALILWMLLLALLSAANLLG